MYKHSWFQNSSFICKPTTMANILSSSPLSERPECDYTHVVKWEPRTTQPTSHIEVKTWFRKILKYNHLILLFFFSCLGNNIITLVRCFHSEMKNKTS